MKIDTIKESLIEALKAKGLNGEYYKDLIDDYVALWHIKEALKANIEEKGVAVEWHNGSKQKGFKQNDSVPNLLKTNMQMLRILADLGLKGAENMGDGDGEL